MTISLFDLFKIGIGPSSSHTVGPMIAACRFVEQLRLSGMLPEVARLSAELFGSLGSTGRGHGTPRAIALGFSGAEPHSVDTNQLAKWIATLRQTNTLHLDDEKAINFNIDTDLKFHRDRTRELHPNGMLFSAFDRAGACIDNKAFYSIGGGFVIDENTGIVEDNTPVPYPFDSAEELLTHARRTNKSIAEIVLANERCWRDISAIRDGIMTLWSVMQECVSRGLNTDGELPGGLHVKRRARSVYKKIQMRPKDAHSDPMVMLDHVGAFALAVNEENAAGGRVVTAPTNGAAGIIPAVLHYYWSFLPGACDDGVIDFFLTAAAIGSLFKKNASISGAEVGCQGEVGSACSMAAGALCAVTGGTPAQIENAAEIAMEHNLGLTCDPIGGLVQIPCIERNAVAAVKAIQASRMALNSDGNHIVSLDKVIKTMRDTGRDMHDKYKETSRGGLAANVVEVPVNFIDC